MSFQHLQILQIRFRSSVTTWYEKELRWKTERRHNWNFVATRNQKFFSPAIWKQENHDRQNILRPSEGTQEATQNKTLTEVQVLSWSNYIQNFQYTESDVVKSIHDTSFRSLRVTDVVLHEDDMDFKWKENKNVIVNLFCKDIVFIHKDEISNLHVFQKNKEVKIIWSENIFRHSNHHPTTQVDTTSKHSQTSDGIVKL